mgnify:FL=1
MEYLDLRAVGPVVEAVLGMGEPVRIAVLPDHPTPCRLRTHTSDPVPFLIWGAGIEPDGVERFDELSVWDGGFGEIEGSHFMDILTGK